MARRKSNDILIMNITLRIIGDYPVNDISVFVLYSSNPFRKLPLHEGSYHHWRNHRRAIEVLHGHFAGEVGEHYDTVASAHSSAEAFRPSGDMRLANRIRQFVHALHARDRQQVMVGDAKK